MLKFYSQTISEAVNSFSSDANAGLTSNEVSIRQKTYGKNLLVIKKDSIIKIILEPFLDIFMLILLFTAALSFLQAQYIDFWVIVFIIFANALIFYIQRYSSKKIIRSLSQKTVHKTTVIRDGMQRKINSDELVPGDIVLLYEGELIPADGRIISESGLITNESMLTGESQPVAKSSRKIRSDAKLYERSNMVFSNSFVVTGSAKILVTAIGNQTEYGRIAKLASSASFDSPIQNKINKLIFKLAIGVSSLALIIFFIQIFEGLSLIDSLKFTLAMLVSAVPEGLPVAISVVLALGSKRMAKNKVLIKNLRAIESLGAVNIIASDKTGTLTENKLTIKKFWSFRSNFDLEKIIAKSAIPASSSADPLDVAILNYLHQNKPYLTENYPVKSFPFDQELKMSGNLYQNKKGDIEIIVKGAPEVLAKKAKLSDRELDLVYFELAKMASHGHKVLALARIKIDYDLNELSELTDQSKINFLGLFSVADSLRKESISAIKKAKQSGIEVKMITGDHAKTAFAIGKELGLVKDLSQVLDCSGLNSLDDHKLLELATSASVFARVAPEDKFRITKALKLNNIVAMTGDGVNDVPALTNAHIGISMGDSSAIVQDAGNIVLLDNNFNNIIKAVKEGRIIITNIRRMLIYLLATNAGEIIAIVSGLLFFGEQILFPLQLLWINLITDSLLVIPIGIEPAENTIINRKPEPKNSPVLNHKLISRIAFIAFIIGSLSTLVYFISRSFYGKEVANSLTFLSLASTQWASAISIRGLSEPISRRIFTRHRPFWFSLIFAVALQFMILFSPMKNIFHTSTLPLLTTVFTVCATFIFTILAIELFKKAQLGFKVKNKSGN